MSKAPQSTVHPILDNEQGGGLLNVEICNPSPKTTLKLIQRLKALIMELIPDEVDIEQLKLPEVKNQVISPDTVSVFVDAGGDCRDAVPFCLLKLKEHFKSEALEDQSDYDEHICRSVACEALARYVVRRVDAERLPKLLSKRFSYVESDGDNSTPSSVLELAIDLHATFFLSSDEAQTAITSLWNGSLLQVHADKEQIEYLPYSKGAGHSLLSHFDPSRIGVPKYQNYLRIVIWLGFLAIYSLSVQSPTEQLNPEKTFDFWEVLLYGMSISFLLEEANKVFKSVRNQGMSSVFSFWTIINTVTYLLLTIAFTLRIAGIFSLNDTSSENLHMLSFEFLSLTSPLIWIKLLPIFDGFLWIGTMELVVIRMIRESFIFFLLLTVFFAGHAQALFALDAADGEQGSFTSICKMLLRSLFGDADFDTLSHHQRFGQPFGEIIFYVWNVVTILILMNVLVALYASSYEGVTDDAVNEFMAFFAGKTISMIRTPDQYVYIAPFNLIEGLFIAPLEYFVNKKTYRKINRWTLSILFFIPLSIIATLEANDHFTKTKFWKSLIDTRIPFDGEGDAFDPATEGEEYVISKHSFNALKSRLPDNSKTLEKSFDKSFKNLADELKTYCSLSEKIQEDIKRVETILAEKKEGGVKEDNRSKSSQGNSKNKKNKK
ncbi:hypothetical protein E3Q04_03994 [Wallemia mellicola]|nr:hypothetical protein E3Q04_03994 [Wallemia mellicola]